MGVKIGRRERERRSDREEVVIKKEQKKGKRGEQGERERERRVGEERETEKREEDYLAGRSESNQLR